MRTEELIQQLAADAEAGAAVFARWPCASPDGPCSRWRRSAVVMLLMGVRRELGDAVRSADFAFEAVLLIVTALSAAFGALVLSIPGAERSPLVRWLPVVAGVACVVWAAGELVFASTTGRAGRQITFAWHCVYKTTSVAAVPGVALF